MLSNTDQYIQTLTPRIKIFKSKDKSITGYVSQIYDTVKIFLCQEFFWNFIAAVQHTDLRNLIESAAFDPFD